jgi:hypothetical protein
MASLGRIYRRRFGIRGGPVKLDCDFKDLRDEAQNFAASVWPMRVPWLASGMR